MQAQNNKILNSQGQAIKLNGINLSNNVWGNWVDGVSDKLEKQGKDPLMRPLQQDAWVLTDADFKRITQLAPKAVRYSINYELFSPNNSLRALNLAKLRENIGKFNWAGIYVIVNLQLPPGLNVQNDNYEREKPGTERIQSLFENEKYWQETLEFWQYLSQNLKDMPGIAGYQLVNEPRLPSNQDGGLINFQQKYQALCSAIRSYDLRHILFIPEYNSRERNPGERYWRQNMNTQQWESATENGEQSIIWERGFVEVNDKNVIYVFSFYEPYEFTHLTASDFNASQQEALLKEKIDWAKRVGVPILMCEFGVSRNQPLENRLRYTKFISQMAKKYEFPAIYWEYKSALGAFTSLSNTFGLYGEYLWHDKEIIYTNNGYDYQKWAQKPAINNKFDPLFQAYFYKNKSRVSIMGNQPIWNELHKLFLSI